MKKIVIASIISICISSIFPILLYFRIDDIDNAIYGHGNFRNSIFMRLTNMEFELKNLPINTSCELSFSSTGYRTVYTDHGVLLIKVNNINPYGTGSRVSFQIGNITNADINKFLITAIIKEKDTDKEQTTEKELSDTLAAGRWTNIALDIPELAPNQLKDTFSFTLAPSSVSLLIPKQ